jgi:hypothetical protein
MSSQHCSRAIGGWLAGCGAATAVVGVFIFVKMATASGGDIAGLVGAFVFATFPLWLIFLVICVLTAIPAAFAILASEKYRIRAIAFFGVTGAGIGAASAGLLWQGIPKEPGGPMLLFAIAGLAAGLAYWRVAGRHAGHDQPDATA